MFNSQVNEQVKLKETKFWPSGKVEDDRLDLIRKMNNISIYGMVDCFETIATWLLKTKPQGLLSSQPRQHLSVDDPRIIA